MSCEKREIRGTPLGDPVKVEINGFGYILIATCTIFTAVALMAVQYYQKEQTELKRQEIEVLKKQYSLDSARFEYLKHHSIQDEK